MQDVYGMGCILWCFDFSETQVNGEMKVQHLSIFGFLVSIQESQFDVEVKTSGQSLDSGHEYLI